MAQLKSFLCGAWTSGVGRELPLVNPTTEQVIAHSLADHPIEAAMQYGRDHGGPALRALTFAARATLLADLANAIHRDREQLIALAVANGGNTRSDAKFDIDGAMATLSFYADLGKTLPGKVLLADGESQALGRTARLAGQHVRRTRPGIAVHINAFNFPAWGMAEKAACAILAGMPVLCKPASSTALVAHRLMVFEPLLPSGALQLLTGSPSPIFDYLRVGDAVAFTGGSVTAEALRRHPAITGRAVALNIEADSLNSAVLGPDASLTSETGNLFLNDVARDITQKAGQKCTAIRRIMVPAARLDEVCDALRERLAAVSVGDPSAAEVRMGPLATAKQREDVLAGIAQLAAATEGVFGGEGHHPGVLGKGYFVSPVLRRASSAIACPVMHEKEVFGPVATVAGYQDEREIEQVIALGGGSLVSSIYTDNKAFAVARIGDCAPWLGRLFIGSEKVAALSAGPGTVLPAMLHGGPGRAGGGEELGGLRGLAFYTQRTAVAADASTLKALWGGD